MDDLERLNIAIAALRDIINPVRKLHREKPPGSQLDGRLITVYLRDPQSYKAIAEEALQTMGRSLD